MELFNIRIVIAALFASGFIMSTSPVEANGGNKVGGVGEINEPTDHVREIVEEIKPQLESELGKNILKIEPVNFRRQVVAGTNYFVKVRLTHPNDISFAHVRIYEGFDRKVVLTKHLADKEEHEKLEYF